MTTGIHTGKSAPLALATSLLSVAVSAFHDNHNPGHASLTDVAKVVRAARDNLKSALDAGYESKNCAIFKAVDLMVIAETYLLGETTHDIDGFGHSPIRSALEVAVELIERELESMDGEPQEPDEAGRSTQVGVAKAA